MNRGLAFLAIAGALGAMLLADPGEVSAAPAPAPAVTSSVTIAAAGLLGEPRYEPRKVREVRKARTAREARKAGDQ